MLIVNVFTEFCTIEMVVKNNITENLCLEKFEVIQAWRTPGGRGS
jgi:hypothetical protein